MNGSLQAMPSGSDRIRRLGMTTPSWLVFLHHQHQQQLPAANLWSLNDKRTAFAQVGVGFEQDVFFFVELEV